uniref:BZIP domain-containing protein n=1 Tax=Globisporangium ultimum (strain ATCC 200006 / CBS 805.95 / DAOM BR144) TaxID=431595 RepID=K3WYL1_GLOUD
MDGFHNLLQATNARGAASGNAANGLHNTLSQALQGHSMSMTQALNGGAANGMALPMGMSLPMPMGATGNGLAPIHRMNQMGSQQMFPSLGMPVPTSVAGSPAASVSSTTTTTSTNGAAAGAKGKPKTAASAASKKRKAPAPPSSVNDGDDSSVEENEPVEYEDPKAKRRAQIAKAARKHRQRQKDELISLRSKVKDLKEQIEVLQSSEPSEHNTELGWKQEAEQHAEIRARVDQENEFLRKTLMEQMKFIQRLQDYFTKQPLLNMPSLDMILNSSSSASTTPAALSNTISAASGTLQLQSSSFKDQLLQLAVDAMNSADKQLTQCESSFRSPKNPTMTYFGLQVQYEMSKNEMGIFFRHQMYNCDARTVGEDLWSCVGDIEFEKKFPFMETAELLEDVDANTKYVRRVVHLTISNDAAQGGTMKEESLTVNQKRENPDGSLYYVARSVLNDPSHPKSADHIRRNQTTAVSLRNFNDTTGTGCMMLWSVKVVIDKEPDERSKTANIPDIILKNLFEISPVYVKAIVDRARGAMQHL